jgi:hypothetical protein
MVLNVVMSGLTGCFLAVSNHFSECWDLPLNQLRRRLLICLLKINADRGEQPRFATSRLGRIHVGEGTTLRSCFWQVNMTSGNFNSHIWSEPLAR